MRTAAIALLVLALLVAAAAAFAPASLVDRGVAEQTGGKLRIENASGTVWNGTGALTDAGNTWRMPLRWNIVASSLLSGTRELVLLPIDGLATPTGTIGVGSNTVVLRNVAMSIPAQALVGGRLPVTLGGAIAVATPSFDWSGDHGVGSVTAQWRDARMVVLGAAADLGVVDVALSPEGNRLAGRIANTGGDVRIDGTISMAGTTVSVDGTLAPTASAPPFIAQSLAALGTPDSTGRVRFAWRGNLR